jgi:hypothetical protein
MIVICELGVSDGAHVPFNAGVLATIRAAFPDEAMSFLAARTHMEEVKKQLGASIGGSVSWTEILPPGSRLPYARRFCCEVKILWDVLRIFRQNSIRYLLLTSANPSTIAAAKLMGYFQLKGTRVQAVLHGDDLSGVGGRRHRHPIRRFQEMRTALTLFGNRHIQYLVLEESIREALLKSLPFLSGKVEVLEHPLAPNEGESSINDLNLPIRFGFLGLANESKGFPLFAKLASEMATQHRGRAEFHAVGRLPTGEHLTPEIDGLATKPGVERLSRKHFIESIKKLDFIIFPHRPQRYELCASGTLLDAIAWQKPLVARRIPIFESMFQRYGDIGYLFRDDMDLRETVENIVEGVDASRYHNQVWNIHKARITRTPTVLAATYREICNKTMNQS